MVAMQIRIEGNSLHIQMHILMCCHNFHNFVQCNLFCFREATIGVVRKRYLIKRKTVKSGSNDSYTFLTTQRIA